VELGNGAAPVVVEGHTDAAPFGASRGYTNWELSADRANAARRALLGAGLREQKVREIRGHADRNLRHPDNPLDPSNRRISVLLPFATAAEVVASDAIPGV
jgi:chemotaxis protein MotB